MAETVPYQLPDRNTFAKSNFTTLHSLNHEEGSDSQVLSSQTSFTSVVIALHKIRRTERRWFEQSLTESPEEETSPKFMNYLDKKLLINRQTQSGRLTDLESFSLTQEMRPECCSSIEFSLTLVKFLYSFRSMWSPLEVHDPKWR